MRRRTCVLTFSYYVSDVDEADSPGFCGWLVSFRWVDGKDARVSFRWVDGKGARVSFTWVDG